MTTATSTARTSEGDKWQPLRDKLAMRQCQYLNTYAQTGDIAALNCLVLGIIAERDDLKSAIQNCLNCANGRQSEWGDRAIDAFEFLDAAIARVEGSAQ